MSSDRLIIDDLARRIAARAGIGEAEALTFVKAWFETAATAIASDRRLEVNGVGTFTVEHDGSVVYLPSPDIAEAINAPFSLFEPVEIAEGVTEADLGSPTPVVKEEAATPAEISEPSEISEISESSEISEISETSEVPETPAIPEPSEPVIVKKGCPWWALVVVAAACYFAGLFTPDIVEYIGSSEKEEIVEPTTPMKRDIPVEIVEDDAVETDEAPLSTFEQEVPVSPTDETSRQHLDTVRVKYYITHMAKRYFGNDNFWSYIYEENKDKLGHPDYTQPGTVVVIPPASKYSIDASDPESVKAAKRLGVEIYNRFRR